MKIFTNYNSKDTPRGAETQTDQVSVTVPDMSYTVRELLNNFTTLPEDISHSATWEEQPQFEDAQPLDSDLTDITENKQRIDKLNADLQQQQAALEKQKSLQKQAKLPKEKNAQNSDDLNVPNEAQRNAVSSNKVE